MAAALNQPVMVRKRTSLRTTLAQSIMHAVLLLLCVMAIVPFVWSFMASFKVFKELNTSTDFFPKVWTLKNYNEIITRVGFFDAMRNSIIVAFAVTFCVLLTSSLLGYVFSKYRFPGKEKLFAALLSTLMLPFAVVLVPLYITVVAFGMQNQLMGIIVVGMWSTFGIFMMRQFMEGIPNELIDAARIDGSSEFRIFSQVILPLSAAPLGALAVMTFLAQWDNYLWPLVVINSPEKQTLPLLLAGLRSLYWTRYDLWTAGSMLTILPVMTLYALASKYFIQGIATTGMKG